MRRNPALYLCDFGYGIRRYDINDFSICEKVDDKTGDYKGIGLGFNFGCLMKQGFHDFYRRFQKILKEA